ncbi:hypothetical protein KAR91_40905 [Candidatus Pacearchaeota archaeon]|nr:hypothetical protein [Candidatus Pacearchaeota archaeon]
MKIYKAWSESMHKVTYTLGYYINKDTARKDMLSVFGVATGSGPEQGIAEIEVVGLNDLHNEIEKLKAEKEKLKQMINCLDGSFTGTPSKLKRKCDGYCTNCEVMRIDIAKELGE